MIKNILVTGGAGFIGSNLVLELQHRHPESKIVVIDDFRSGSFKNLRGFKGDFVAADVSRLEFEHQFFGEPFDAIFHLASITDTTEHDQFMQVQNNVEGFRRVLEFAVPTKTPVIYASSAATYGISLDWTSMDEMKEPDPANVYAFSKVQLDNLARIYREKIQVTGLRYFNVYGRGEGHKGKSASMVHQLWQQLKRGERPKVFEWGEQKRDFVYIKDAVNLTIAAAEAGLSDTFNCGSGSATSFNEVIDILRAVLKVKHKTEYFGDVPEFFQPFTQADMLKAKTMLGFEPQWNIRDGILDMLTA